MKVKGLIMIIVLAAIGTSVWAQALDVVAAQAAYDARVAEGNMDRTKPNNPADLIYRAVRNAYRDKKDPAQAAYDTRVAEGNMDRTRPNNPADLIFRAVRNAHNEKVVEMAAQAAYDTRVAEGNMDRTRPNNPADLIYRAVRKVHDDNRYY